MRIDVWDEEEQIRGIINYPQSIGRWTILSHQIKKISIGCITIGLNQNVIDDAPTVIEDKINAGADDRCFSKTLGLMNNLLPYSLQVKEHIEKDKLMIFAFDIFNYMFSIENVINYLNEQYQIVIERGVSKPQVISGSVIDIPSIPELDSKVHSFAINAKHILLELINFIVYIYQIRGNVNYTNLSSSSLISSKLSDKISELLDDIFYLWDLRNKLEHPKDNYFCKINNFSFMDGQIVIPNLFIKDNDKTITEQNLVGKLNYFYEFLLNFTESVFNITIEDIKKIEHN